MDLREQMVSSQTIFEGKIVKVTLDQARLPNGRLAEREVVYHPGGVAVLALEEDGTVYLVRQFRYPIQRELLELRRISEDVGLPVCSVGGIISFSIYPLTAQDPSIAQKSMDAVRRMLDAAQTLGAGSILVVPGIATEDLRYEQAYETAQTRVAQLADYAPGIQLMIENVWNNMLYSPLEMARFVDEMGKENVGICFDIANARRFGSPEQWMRTLGRRIRELHCKDYRMSIDNINGFTNILDGDVNYPAVLAAAREIGFDGSWVVELIPPAHCMVDRTLRHALETLRALDADEIN